MALTIDDDAPEFRERLYEAVQVTDAFSSSQVTERVTGLASDFGRHIQCIHKAIRAFKPPYPGSPEINCHAYSLEIYDTEEFLRILVEPESPFMESLDEHGLLDEIPINDAAEGDLILYRSDDETPHSEIAGQILHSGRVTGPLIRSKWGQGSVYEHTVFAVPSGYGSDLRAYSPPSREDVVAAYLDFCKYR